MAKQKPREWKGPRLSIFDTLISHADAAVIGAAGGIDLEETIQGKFWSEDGQQQETRTVTKLDYLQHRLNALAQHYEYDSTRQNGPTHQQTIEALAEIRKAAKKLRKKLGLVAGTSPDDAWDTLPTALYHELSIPARQIASTAAPGQTEPIYTADSVLRVAVSGFLTLEQLVEDAHEGARLVTWKTNSDEGADVALSALILALGKLYETVSGRRAGVSNRRSGGADGPFVRFGCRACKCMGIRKITPDGLGSRFKRARRDEKQSTDM